MATTPGKRAAVYVRISKDKAGAGLGVQRQESACRKLADDNGWTVVDVYTDNDLSAYRKRSKRKEYARMLADIAAGRIDVVIAWHTDRLHRSPKELEGYIDACQPREVATHCVQAGQLDLTTASGRLTARVTGAVARHESEHASERIRAQKDAAAAAGEWTGSGRPFGYRFTHDSAGKVVTVEIDDVEAAAIRDGVRSVLAGESVYSVTRRWQETVKAPRAKKWAQGNVTRILKNPRHAGIIVHNGQVIDKKGTWPPIITEDEHKAVAALLSDPKRTTYSGTRSLKWVGSGLYRCSECGSDLRSASVNNRDGTLRRTYRCRSTRHVNINGEALDRYVIEVVSKVLDAEGSGLIPDVDAHAVDALHDTVNTLSARLVELGDAFGDGDLTRAEYVRQKQRVQDKITTAEDKLGSLRTGSALDGIATATHPSEAFRAQPIARQRAIIDAVVSVVVHPAKRGRLPKGVELDYDRVHIRPKADSTTA